MDRRDLLKLLPALALVPAIVKAIPSKPTEPRIVLYGDGIRDDTKALQAWADGQDVYWNGEKVGDTLRGGTFKVTELILFGKKSQSKFSSNSHFITKKGKCNCPPVLDFRRF